MWCPSVNSFKFQCCDHTLPINSHLKVSHYMELIERQRMKMNERTINYNSESYSIILSPSSNIAGHYRLLLGLQRYLIVFATLTLVLQRRVMNCSPLSPLFLGTRINTFHRSPVPFVSTLHTPRLIFTKDHNQHYNKNTQRINILIQDHIYIQ